MATHISGIYTDCGYGQNFSVTATCDGPNCAVLTQFPGFTCTNQSQSLVCTNSVTCSGTSNTTSNIIVDQNGDTFVDTVSLMIANDSFTTQATVTATVPYSATAAALATPSVTSSAPRGRKFSKLAAFLVLIVFSMMIPTAYAQTGPPSPANIVNNLFGQVTSSQFIQNIFQGIAKQTCAWFVSKGVQQALLAAGNVVTEELKEAEGALILDCQELVEAALIEDPPLALAMAWGGKILCTFLVSKIMEGPFNTLGSEICQAVANLSNNQTVIVPPMITFGNCDCLAPTCICPDDDGLPPLCGSTRDAACSLCSCAPPVAEPVPAPAPAPAPEPGPAPGPASPAPIVPPSSPNFGSTPIAISPTSMVPVIGTTPAPAPAPGPPPATPPSAGTCSCLAPTCICPEDEGMPPLCGTTRDPSCGLCTC
jgi:hypothetical protein